MKVNNIIPKRKFIGDIPEDEMEIIEEACDIEKRSRISLIRKATVEYARKMIKNKENGNTD